MLQSVRGIIFLTRERGYTISALCRNFGQCRSFVHSIRNFYCYNEMVPSLDKGKRGFDRRKCAHTSSSPLTIRQYSLRVFSRLNTFPLWQNCFAPDSDGFSVIFVFLDAGGLAPAKAKRTKSAEKTRCQACLPLSSDGRNARAVVRNFSGAAGQNQFQQTALAEEVFLCRIPTKR